MAEVADSKQMTALIPNASGALKPASVARPVPGEHEVLVRVRAAGINRADLAQLAGLYPPPPGASDVLGLEVAGEVAGFGPGLSEADEADPEAGPYARLGLDVGTPVCALLPGGGYAEYVSVPAAMLMPVQPGWTMLEAAAWPEVAFTAFLNLFLEARLRPGERLLVHAGASGVGTMAIAMAKAAGAAVYATAGGPAKVGACLAQGADLAFDRYDQEFAAALAEHGVDGVDVVLDVVGRAYFDSNIDSLRPGGRLVVISTLSGGSVELDLRRLMAKRLRLIGSTLRARPVPEKVDIKRALFGRFGSRLAAGELKPVIDSTAPWTDVSRLHAKMSENLNIGKLVLEVA
ncbi:MAG: NAD(P)H-quinone oxidoreductase [Truepera sp.]|jgi:putative PIG3 family NAD(P)H quinone oxidoreductase|nr:NAD(P)H-quinone oxidoreductase [Truepera sp.]